MKRDAPDVAEVLRESCEEVARRLSDVLLRALFDYTNAHIFAKDLSGRYIFVNKRFLDIFSIREEDVIGKTLFDLYPEEAALQLQREQAPVLRGGVVEIIKTKLIGDEEHAYNLVIFPLMSRDGEIVGIGGIGRDFTEQRRNELRLIEAMRSSMAVRRSSEIGHDLNNIIFGITGHAVLALEDAADEKLVREDLERILKATEEAAGFVKASFPREQRRLAFATTSPAAPLKSVAGLVRRTFSDRIEVRESYAADAPAVRMDREKIEHALIDLCIHARECMPGGGSISFSAEHVEAPPWGGSTAPGGVAPGNASSGCLIAVRCDGIELSSIQPSQVTAHASAVGQVQGTPGVALLKGLVREHGGSLHHEHAGRSVSCEIFLPAVYSRPGIESSANRETLSLAGTVVYLVSEDEGLMRDLEGAFEGAEYRIFSCRSASDALKTAHEGSIGAAIIDQRLAGMNPLALVKALSGLQGHAAILLASLSEDPDVLRLFREAGAVRIITKPLSYEVIRSSVAETLRDLLQGTLPK